MKKERIGVIGSGVVGQVLAGGFLKHGFEVMIGSRDGSKLDDWQATNPGGKTGTFSQAAQFGEILVLSVKGIVAAEALKIAGPENLKGKVIIDTTNPIAEKAPENGVLHFFTDLERSLMEQLQAQFPEGRFVKAFSSVGNALMVNPDFGGVKPGMFICGNEDAAKGKVKEILDLFGWETEDMGKAEAARAIEPLCILWCIPGFMSNDWMHAFKVLRK